MWGYWLVTYMMSMLDCHEIEIEKRKEIERRIEELTKIGISESWKTLNGQDLQSSWSSSFGKLSYELLFS